MWLGHATGCGYQSVPLLRTAGFRRGEAAARAGPGAVEDLLDGSCQRRASLIAAVRLPNVPA